MAYKEKVKEQEMTSDKLCWNCEYGEYARELCGFYPDRDLKNGCKHFKAKSELQNRD